MLSNTELRFGICHNLSLVCQAIPEDMELYFIISRKMAMSWSVCVVDVNMKDRVLVRQPLQRRMTSELPLATSSSNQTMVG